MKKKIILLIILIAVFVVLGIVFKNPKMSPSSSSKELVVVDSFEVKVLNEDSTFVKVDVKYPSFKNVSEDFNTQIKNLLQEKIDEHKKASGEYWQARYDTQTKGENIPKVPTSDDKLSFFSDFVIVQSNSNYISFVLKYGGFSGGAHGYENYVTYNYDVKNQKIVGLSDLFKNNTDYLKYLSDESRKDLKEKYATLTEEDKKNSSDEAVKEYINNMVLMIEDGTKPTAENFSTFTFTPDKVKIYFAQYQVGPYAIGMPEVEVERE